MADKKSEVEVSKITEKEALHMVRACTDAVEFELEKLNGTSFTNLERLQFRIRFEESVLRVIARHFAIIPDQASKIRKNPR
ncbi:MAG: hypothetical protein UX07_C0044G0004 [Parcubacteria group bacterium GW2011_GWA2_45_30]|nr:MAG: hypothetical protein UX07_C0044G0004 [Parcubacteria group bacterium GW2011_GWA2_45_30]